MRAAERRVLEADVLRAADASIRRHRRKWAAWRARQVAVVAELLDMPPEKVTPALIGFCRGWYGRPDEPEPQLRPDRRFRAFREVTAGADVEPGRTVQPNDMASQTPSETMVSPAVTPEEERS